MHWLAKTALLLMALKNVYGQGGCEGGSCFPSTGDLLVGRGNMLKATSTCGQNGPQPYCIVSHLENVRKCFECDASDPARSHEVQNVITTFNDRLETWWQSENGKQDVSIQLDLEAEFQFTHMIMTFKTFRPAAMLIERSLDFGRTWAVYRYFAYDCEKSFPSVPLWPPQEIDDVICDNRYSQIEPSNQGEVIYRVLEPFIRIEDPYAPKIQNLLKITNLRFNFTELHTLGDDLLDAREDIKSKYYYALYELIVRGNCFCYGHADTCTPIRETTDLINGFHMRPGANTEVHGRCQCQHNTVGLNCEQCKPFYQDQPWRPAEDGMPHECQPCNCNNHATECHFDPAVYEATGQVSGGVCENCQHNTVGRQCEQCAPFFYQDPQKDIRDPTVCAACDCEVAGSLDGGICDSLTNPDQGMIAGQCRCKRYVEGPRCDQCKPGYYGLDESNLDGCTACDCDSLGTLSGANTCNPIDGQCNCKRYTTGRRCDMCLPQTWGMSALIHGCRECDCDIGGAYDNDCDQTSGQCRCRPNIHNRRCDLVVSGNFLPALDHYLFEAENAIPEKDAYPDNRTRDRPPVTWTGDGFMLVKEGGSIVFIVNGLPTSMDYHLILRYQSNGEWRHVGVSIDRPNRGNIPTRSPCGNTRPEDDSWMTSLPGPPTTHHDLGIICLEQNYTYRVTVDLSRMGDEPFPEDLRPDILIDSLIVVPVHSNMDIFSGTIEGRNRGDQFDELNCLDREMEVPDQRPEDECSELLFSMSAIIHDGARACDCDLQGSESSICNDWGGQCRCKRNVIGRRCDRCAPGTYGFGPAGCRPCDCDSRGSSSKFCNRESGQCPCLNGISGRRCDRCKAGHYRYPQCLACTCNGHADTCDQNTGECIQCRDNTMGEHCENCISGYYGNPVLGSLDQCKRCMCPGGPNSGLQHATGCRFDQLSGQVQCFCMDGYAGSRCDECAPAYWGNPNAVNGICRRCDCGGNVDSLDPGACDAATGVCTGCLYNTAGPHCERCKDFYYGSAADRTCRACACNLLGTQRSVCVNDQCQCDVLTGQCDCLPNVSGRNCDQCVPNHWKLASGQGCEPCDCNLENSDGPACNEFTGQCECVEGFGGRTCNDCADGHFGNPNIQCYACECDSNGSVNGQCHSRTGQCECKEGVGGRTCSRCLRGFTGDVPDCQPCGECFDNWDNIINDLKNRTQRAIAKAQEIGESGLPGGYENELDEIEKMLDSIPTNFSAGQEEITRLVDFIKKKLDEQEERLQKLEEDMNRIRSSDQSVNANMDDIETEKQRLEEKLENLQAQKQNITKASPIAAFKEVQDAAEASMQAERVARAATTDSGSLVEQSGAVRADVEEEYDDKKREFDDKLSQVEDDLTARKTEIDELTVSQLNEDVCGKATEDCDQTCGGAGCDTCGGIGCPGAVQFATDAKSRAQKTQANLARVAEETSELSVRVALAKDNAEEAKHAAQAAKNRAEEVEEKIRNKNGEIQKLIQDIRTFLSDEKSNPSDIEEVALQVLALSLPINRAEINALGDQIRDLVNRLPDVDDVVAQSKENLELAKQLLEDANRTRASAESVANDVTAVVRALDQANNASTQAEAAKNQAIRDIERAEEKISEINSAIGDLAEQMTDIAKDIEQYESRLRAVERQMSDSQLSLNDAEEYARDAKSIAQQAADSLNGKRELISEATDAINGRKDKADRLAELKRKAEALLEEVNGHNEKLDGISSLFDRFESTMQDKDAELQELLNEAERLYEAISNTEEVLRTCK